LLLPFVARHRGKATDRFHVGDLTAERTRDFLLELEQRHGCGAAMCDQHWERSSFPNLIPGWMIHHLPGCHCIVSLFAHLEKTMQ
jgi:hypothetical protein